MHGTTIRRDHTARLAKVDEHLLKAARDRTACDTSTRSALAHLAHALTELTAIVEAIVEEEGIRR